MVMIKNISTLIIFLFIAVNSQGQQVGHLQYTFTDPARSNRTIATEIYYPSSTAGNNVPISSGTFPLIVFGHGFVMDWSAYENFWDSLVTDNYIVVFPTTESSFSPVHQDMAEDLKFLITEIKNNGAGSIITSSSIAGTSAIMGHSMGGGSSFLAAENNSSITTMVSYAAANTNPSSIDASKNITIPTLIFSGTNDCVAPPTQHQDIMYDSCAAAFKTQIYIFGGGHCFFANNNLFCSIGEGTCTPTPTISRQEQQTTVNSFLKMWLSYYLKGECTKAQEFQDSLMLSSRISYRQNQPLSCLSTIKSSTEKFELNIFPNPISEFINLSYKEIKINSISIVDFAMKEYTIPSKYISNNTIQIDASSLCEGIYMVVVNNSIRKLFIKV